jgi:formate dehydrogenase major subunit
MAEGPFPEHYEPFESPIPNVLHPKVRGNPAARVFADDREAFGRRGGLPLCRTTYRLTEHFHYWTKHALINAILQPEEFVEIGEVLAKEKGIDAGRLGARLVEARLGRLQGLCHQAHQAADGDGKPTHVIGVPIHWGFTGQARKGYGANTLTPFVGDANTRRRNSRRSWSTSKPTSAPAVASMLEGPAQGRRGRPAVPELHPPPPLDADAARRPAATRRRSPS